MSITAVSGHLRLDADLRDKLVGFGPPAGWEQTMLDEYRERHGDDWEAVLGGWV